MAASLAKAAFQLYPKLPLQQQRKMLKWMKKINKKVTSANIKEVMELFIK